MYISKGTSLPEQQVLVKLKFWQYNTNFKPTKTEPRCAVIHTHFKSYKNLYKTDTIRWLMTISSECESMQFLYMTCLDECNWISLLTSITLLVSMCERRFRGRQKMHETIGCPFCFPSFCCYGWHVLSIGAIRTMSQLVPPPTATPPSPPAIITSPPLCFPSISIVYASLVLPGPRSIFRHASLLHVRLLLSSFWVSFPNLCAGLFLAPAALCTGASTDTCFTMLGWVGSSRRFWVSGTWQGKKKVLTLILFTLVPKSNMWPLTRIML